MPQGLKVSPQIWAKAADKILQPVSDIASWYVDDIFCGSETFDKHLKDVDRVLSQLLESGLKVRFEKCLFFKKKVMWLGHILSKQGIEPDPKGVLAIKNLKPPENIKQVRSLLGTLVYFKDFIDKFSDLTAPLTAMLQKGKKIIWGEEQDKALNALKNALTNDTILAKPDSSKDYYLQTDASDIAVSAILSQKHDNDLLRPIQYWSKKLNGPELNYFPTEKEAFAIFLAFKKFETFLLLNKTHVITDASALLAFYGTKDITNRRILRWALYVGQFEHDVTHIKGPDNVLADLVSRCVTYPCDVMTSILANRSVPNSNLSQQNIISHQENDPLCIALSKYCGDKTMSPPIRDWPHDVLEQYKISIDGLLLLVDLHQEKAEKIVVPYTLVPVVLYFDHDDKFSNHQGVDRTCSRIQRNYHWNSLRKDTNDYVLSCIHCQKYKTNVSPYFTNFVGKMKIIADSPNEILFVDIAYLPRSQEGYLYILVIVDSFSRFLEAIPLRTMTAQEIVKSITSYCCIHGFPNQMFSDAAGDFKKAMMDTCSHLLKVNHIVSIPWRHQSNVSERYIQQIKTGIRLMVKEEQIGYWPRYIRFVIYALNTSYCKSLNTTPFEAYFSRKPLVQPSVGNIPLPEQYFTNHDDWIQEYRQKIKDSSVNMKDKYRTEANKHIKQTHPNVVTGQLVMIRKTSFTPGIAKKLQAVREGPLRVLSIAGSRIKMEFVDQPSHKRERHISDLARYYERPRHLLIERIENDLQTEQIELRELEPISIRGDLWSVDRGISALLVLGWDCLTLVPNLTLSNKIKATFRYFNQTGSSIQNESNKQFVKRARKTGQVYFYESRTRHGQGPAIAAVVTKILLGPPAEFAGTKTVPDVHQSLPSKDTSINREQWLSESLNKIKDWVLQKPGTTITSIYLEEAIFKTDSSLDNLWLIVKRFTWCMNTHGVKIFSVTRSL